MFKYENNCYNGDIGELIVATELVKNNIDVCKSLMNNNIASNTIGNKRIFPFNTGIPHNINNINAGILMLYKTILIGVHIN